MRTLAIITVLAAAAFVAALAAPAAAEPGRDNPKDFDKENRRIIERLDRLEKALDRLSRTADEMGRRNPEKQPMKRENPAIKRDNQPKRGVEPQKGPQRPQMRPEGAPGMEGMKNMPGMPMDKPGKGMTRGGMNMCPECMRKLQEELKKIDMDPKSAERIGQMLMKGGMNVTCPHRMAPMPGANPKQPGRFKNRGTQPPQNPRMKEFNSEIPNPGMMPGQGGPRVQHNLRPNAPNQPSMQEYLKQNPELQKALRERYNERMSGRYQGNRDRIDALLDRILEERGRAVPRQDNVRRPQAVPQNPQPQARRNQQPPQQPNRRVQGQPQRQPQPNFRANPGVFGEDVIRPNVKRFEDATKQLEPKFTEKEFRSMPLNQLERIIGAKEKELGSLKGLLKNRRTADQKGAKQPDKKTKAPEKKNPPQKKNPPKKKVNIEENLNIDELDIQDDEDVDEFFSDVMYRMNEFFYSLEPERTASF
jgi:hypothetical protein